jgi:hypothetical protein
MRGLLFFIIARTRTATVARVTKTAALLIILFFLFILLPIYKYMYAIKNNYNTYVQEKESNLHTQLILDRDLETNHAYVLENEFLTLQRTEVFSVLVLRVVAGCGRFLCSLLPSMLPAAAAAPCLLPPLASAAAAACLRRRRCRLLPPPPPPLACFRREPQRSRRYHSAAAGALRGTGERETRKGEDRVRCGLTRGKRARPFLP